MQIALNYDLLYKYASSPACCAILNAPLGLFVLKLKYDKYRVSSTWCAVKAHLHLSTFLFCLINEQACQIFISSEIPYMTKATNCYL